MRGTPFSSAPGKKLAIPAFPAENTDPADLIPTLTPWIVRMK